ncbi:MAG: CTP synthase [Christensenellaceae bacterium]|jgi:CTP synthase|nr:CTP synthase [Christensenellaceae bacterium]
MKKTGLPKYIFITGGVVSGLGKGITAASLGRLLINRGLKVTIQKLDPYINVDPGTMSPYQHGEVFVTDDGAETDLDIGHYERFLGRSFSKDCNYTTGKIYSSVIAKERAGEYLGKTVQVVPHITNEIIDAMKSVAGGEDIVIVEVGGTIGDIEGMAYIEAIRQFRKELGPKGSLSVHVTLIPYLDCSGEIKTKPTQNSVRDLSRMGVTPDIVVCRTNADVILDSETRDKVAMFCNLDSPSDVILNQDCRSIYEVPILLKQQKFDDIVLKKLGLKASKDSLGTWKKMVKSMTQKHVIKTIAIVGKYVAVPDAYISVTEAVKHAGLACGVSVSVKLIDSEDIEKQGAEKLLSGTNAIIIPGGFGNRGIEGKIMAAQYARKNKIPFLGLCLGMQIAVIEFARNMANLPGANSSEFAPETPYPVIDIMKSQKDISKKGGTMRLGLYNCKLTPKTKAAELYGADVIKERHRHRFEFNNKFKSSLEKAGLTIAGINEENNLVEIIELNDHPYYVASQFHPEFLSRPYTPHPLFRGLIKATI